MLVYPACNTIIVLRLIVSSLEKSDCFQMGIDLRLQFVPLLGEILSKLCFLIFQAGGIALLILYLGNNSF